MDDIYVTTCLLGIWQTLTIIGLHAAGGLSDESARALIKRGQEIMMEIIRRQMERLDEEEAEIRDGEQ